MHCACCCPEWPGRPRVCDGTQFRLGEIPLSLVQGRYEAVEAAFGSFMFVRAPMSAQRPKEAVDRHRMRAMPKLAQRVQGGKRIVHR